MSVNVNTSTTQVHTGTNLSQNMKVNNSYEKETNTTQSENDNTVKLSISQEGIESYRKKFHESGLQTEDGKVIEKKQDFIKQAKNSIFANYYENELAKKANTLKEQREHTNTYSLSNKVEDYVKAYANLYDEIVQGYKNGTRERYVEDENSNTGFRKMTMEEELNSLDKAFQKTSDRETTLAENERKAASAFKNMAQKLSKYKSTKTSFADAYKKLEEKGITSQENVGQKMITLAQAWKNTYQISGSNDNGIQKVLSMLSDMFPIHNQA